MSHVGAEVYHVKFYFFPLVEVFIKVTIVLAMFLVEDSVMSLLALLCANSSDILTWTTETIDGILIEGDVMYLEVFEERSIPDEETISLNYLEDATEDDLKDAVIDLGLVSISYDGHSKQLISIEQIKI